MWGSEKERRELGLLWVLWHGEKPRRDRKRGLAELRRLAELGYAPAVCGLAAAYHSGEAVTQDVSAAWRLYQQAAEDRYPSAEAAVGNFFVTAAPEHGVCEYDPARAADWHKRAAAQGNAGAQYNLAFSFWTGRDVERDVRSAYFWAGLAVHCSPIRIRPAETLREQAAAALDATVRAEVEQESGRAREQLPLPWSEHLTYWKHLARAAGVEL